MAFTILPIEVNGLIASVLNDLDLCAFSLVCRNTYAAVNCHGSSVWRDQFVKHFDLVPKTTRNNKLKEIYQYRKRVLKRGAHFTQGHTRREKDCLVVLQDLILEAYAAGPHVVKNERESPSSNIECIRAFAKKHDILLNVLSPKHAEKQNPLLLVIQIMMAHLQFDLNVFSPTLGFPDSQKTVYSTAQVEPIFKGANKAEINMQFVAQTLNFFKYHMTRKEEQSKYEDYEELRLEERIRPWRRRLGNGVHKLGTRWKGTYAYVHDNEQQRVREMVAAESIFVDMFNDEKGDGGFQTLELDFSAPSISWPQIFERHLHSRSHPSMRSFTRTPQIHPSNHSTVRTRAQLRANPPGGSARGSRATKNEPTDPLPLGFTGAGIDAEGFYASGWLNPLPAQQGIPGWMRWTMMKYFVDEDEADGAEDAFSMKKDMSMAALDLNSLWAYEGVVLPGGEVVVGRWWGPKEEGDLSEPTSGPFMFWCVDEHGCDL